MANNRRKVHLTKKFAAFLNGIDLSRVEAGDDIELPERQALLLIAEGWALPAATRSEPAIATDRPSRRVTTRQRRKT